MTDHPLREIPFVSRLDAAQCARRNDRVIANAYLDQGHALPEHPNVRAGRKKAYTAGDTSHARGVPFYPYVGGIPGTMPHTDPMRDGGGIHHDDCTCKRCR